MSHITGGGLLENIPRMLPPHLTAEIDVHSFERPTVFAWLQRMDTVRSDEMSRAFNNGLGMVVSDAASGEVLRALEADGETVYRVGRLVRRKEGDGGCVWLNLDAWDT